MISKVGLRFPDIAFDDLLQPYSYKNILKIFYRQNQYGYDDKDIDQQGTINIQEFDLNDVPQHPFVDTPPENVDKHPLDDYLLPLVERTKNNFIGGLEREYDEKQDYGDSAILKLKDKYINYLNTLIISTKESKHLIPGLKPKLLETLKKLVKYVDVNINTNFADDFSEKKIKIKLNAKEVCHLMTYLNENQFFNKKHEPTELAHLIELHFQYQVGTAQDFTNFTNTKQMLSNSIYSEQHSSTSEKLNKILKEYPQTILKAKKK